MLENSKNKLEYSPEKDQFLDQAGIKIKVQDKNDIISIKSLVKKYFPKVRWGKVQLGFFFIMLYLLSFRYKFFEHPTNTMITELRQAVFGLYMVQVYIGIIVLPTPSIIAPHPLFWRTIQAFGFAYLVIITCLLFFSFDNLSWILANVFDPKLVESPNMDRDYTMDCRIYTPENPVSKFANITACFDVYCVCHLIGWLVKAAIFRNYTYGWISSISFELVELTFRYWYGNFNECWWDSMLLDLFGMNLIGLLVGQWIIDTFNLTKYHWFMEPNEKMERMSAWENFKYFFTARNEYKRAGKWHMLSSATNFLHVMWFNVFVLLVDLSNFLNKFNQNIPSDHWLLGIRVWTVGMFAILAAADYYKYVVYRKGYSMGITLFMSKCMLIAEMLLYFKHFDRNIYNVELPIEVYVYWGIFFTIVAIIQQYQTIEDLFFSHKFKNNKAISQSKKIKADKKLNELLEINISKKKID